MLLRCPGMFREFCKHLLPMSTLVFACNLPPTTYHYHYVLQMLDSTGFVDEARLFERCSTKDLPFPFFLGVQCSGQFEICPRGSLAILIDDGLSRVFWQRINILRYGSQLLNDALNSSRCFVEHPFYFLFSCLACFFYLCARKNTSRRNCSLLLSRV